jgi:hypothetical protein
MPTLPFLLLAPASGGAPDVEEDGDDFVEEDMADRTLVSHDSRAMGVEIDLAWKQVGELSYATHHQEESKNQPLAFIYIGGE